MLIRLTIEQVAEITEGRLLGQANSRLISQIAIDSRQIIHASESLL
ncbi:hypothetical protein [Algoriphagus sp.]